MSVAVLCSVVVALSGCAAASAPGSDAAGGSDAAPTASASVVQRRPLDAFTFSRQEHVTILSALQILKERCMARYGFALRESGAPHRPADTVRPDNDSTQLFDIPDPSQGYALVATPAQRAADARAAENRRYLDTLPPMSAAYALAFGGRFKRHDAHVPASLGESVDGVDVYPTGCEGWAWDQIAPDDTTEGVFPLIREIDPWAAAAADPRVGQANALWSSCMKTAGYDYDRPDAIQDEDRKSQLVGKTGAEGIAAAQRQEQRMRTLAPIDAECRKSSGYFQVRLDILTEYDHRVIEQHAAELTEQRARMDAEVRRAADIVKEAGQ